MSDEADTTEKPPGEGPPLGEGQHSPAVEAPPVEERSPRSQVSWMSLAAGFCGLAGLAAVPFLIAGTPGRYLILVADILALALGGAGLWAAFKYRARFDWAVLGLMTGGISLFLYVAYVTDPPTAAGGT